MPRARLHNTSTEREREREAAEEGGCGLDGEIAHQLSFSVCSFSSFSLSFLCPLALTRTLKSKREKADRENEHLI